MNRAQVHALTFFRAADPFEIPSLNAVRPETSLTAADGLAILGFALATGVAPGSWYVWASLAVVYWLAAYIYRTRRNPLEEPVLRLNTTSPRPGQDLFVGCVVTPKNDATIRRIEFGFETDETHGEDVHTETYPGWECTRECFLSAPVSLTVAGTLAVPELRERYWERSKRAYYITLTLVVMSGSTIRRRYQITLPDPPRPPARRSILRALWAPFAPRSLTG